MSTFVNTSSISQKIIAGFWSNGDAWASPSLDSERGGEDVLWGGDEAVRWIPSLSRLFHIPTSLHVLTHTYTKPTSLLQDQYSSPDCREESNRSLEKFALAAQKQTHKQIKPKSCLKLVFVACVLQKRVINKSAWDFGDPSFHSKRTWFPVCGCFILGRHRKSLSFFFLYFSFLLKL